MAEAAGFEPASLGPAAEASTRVVNLLVSHLGDSD